MMDKITAVLEMWRDVHLEPPPLDLDAFEALEQAATPGWWRAGAHDRDRVFCHYAEALEGPMGERVLIRFNEHFPRVEADAAFVAASRAWVRPLIGLARHGLRASAPEALALQKAIRAITADLPDDQPNGPAEQAILELQRVLDPDTFWYGADPAAQRLDAAREAAAALCEALADETRDLRVAAEAYFGGDFSAPQEGAG